MSHLALFPHWRLYLDIYFTCILPELTISNLLPVLIITSFISLPSDIFSSTLSHLALPSRQRFYFVFYLNVYFNWTYLIYLATCPNFHVIYFSLYHYVFFFQYCVPYLISLISVYTWLLISPVIYLNSPYLPRYLVQSPCHLFFSVPFMFSCCVSPHLTPLISVPTRLLISPVFYLNSPYLPRDLETQTAAAAKERNFIGWKDRREGSNELLREM